MAGLLDQWRKIAYNEQADRTELQNFWANYFNIEKDIYEQLLSDPDTEVRGTVKELAEKYGQDVMTMVGFLDGINESLKEENPIEDLSEDTQVNLVFDKALLYKNMVAAKADWLYELPQWKEIFSEEELKALYKEQRDSGTVRKPKKIGRNDPCPCGSGKKYKLVICHFTIRVHKSRGLIRSPTKIQIGLLHITRQFHFPKNNLYRLVRGTSRYHLSLSQYVPVIGGHIPMQSIIFQIGKVIPILDRNRQILVIYQTRFDILIYFFHCKQMRMWFPDSIYQPITTKTTKRRDTLGTIIPSVAPIPPTVGIYLSERLIHPIPNTTALSHRF